MSESAVAMVCLEQNDDAAIFRWQNKLLRIGFVTPSIARITCTEGKPFEQSTSRIVIERSWTSFALQESPQEYVLTTAGMSIVLDRATAALRYFNSEGVLLFREPERGGKWLTPKPVYRNVFADDPSVALADNIDGVRAAAAPSKTVFDRTAFEAKLEFVFSDDEALFGLGSHEEGYGNLRGRWRELYQQNLKAVVPSFVSTRVYGVLFDCGSLMTFRDDALGSYWWADAVDELDFYVIAGDDFQQITRGYHYLTGSVPLPPKWAFGYVQSKERYVTADEMLEVAREYRRRQIPLDALVLDWKSWPNGGAWGQKSLDPMRFPDPDAFVEQLHAMGVRLMVSIWPIMTGNCENRRELLEAGAMLGNQSTYNAFSEEARQLYWKQAQRGLFAHGVDAWWCDCTEPFEADWNGAVKPEPHLRLALNTGESKRYLDAAEINAYSLVHSQGIYEGQRAATEQKRVLNLTRSAYAGQHRYGTFTWNGDTSATWETLRRSIAEGVNFCATGEPYWTVDIGGFFVDNDPSLWFWRGDYHEGCRGLTDMDALEPDANDTGCLDHGYWELYTRWLQFAAFLPMFRSHGTDAAREIWRFGDEGTTFYDVIARFIRLRYRLLPYIYSVAAQVTFASASMVRAVALGFSRDIRTHHLYDQFLFGPSLLVCPVTQAMYFAAGSRPITNVPKSRPVYLPGGADWFDFWTEKLYRGGQEIMANAPLEIMPLFVRAGSILPMAQEMQFTDEVPDAPYELLVYAGADATFMLYEDAGDGYAYERGECAFVRIEWVEQAGELLFHQREGAFPQMIKERVFHVVVIADSKRRTREVSYRGDALRVSMREER